MDGIGAYLLPREVRTVADTMGTREASEKWGFSQSTIAIWCKEGKIEGATQYRNRGP